MTETQSPQDIHALIESGAVRKPVVPITQEQLLGFATNDTPLDATSVQMGPADEFGFRWVVNAVIDDQPVAFTLRGNMARDAFMEALSIHTVNGPVTGLKLSAQDANGFKRVVIVPA